MKKKGGNSRYIFIGVCFSVVCLAFVIVLAFVQSKGTDLPERVEGYERTYTVPGLRGEIYDRNGKKLVANADSYDLVFEYGAMPDTRADVNRSLIAIMNAIRATDDLDSLSDDYFILDGTYPDMEFTSDVKDKESREYYFYEKFLERQKMDAKKTDADDVVSYFVGRYRLYESAYTNEEITDLIRLYYEMERVDFGVYASYTIATGISDELRVMLDESNIEGVNFDVRSERVYLYPGVASHILGTVGKITAENKDHYIDLGYPLDATVGVSGCEATFEEHLRGSDGVMVVRYDDNGRLIEKKYKVEPKSGKDVYLTIDIDLQIASEKALAENVAMIDGSDQGAVTAVDPNTGEVLALASYPTYDLSKMSDSLYFNSIIGDTENRPMYNRALSGVYAPGSTYKIGVALAALENGYIDESDQENCQMYYYPGGPECLHYHGNLNVVGAIRESCNIFFYHLGEAMGIDSITEYTKPLGLGVDVGLELDTKLGIIAGPEYRESVGGSWLPGDDLSSAIGQSDHGYTPLQMSVYMASVVNGGTRYNYHILDSVKEFGSKDESVVKTEVKVLDKVEFSDHTYDLLIEAMRQVVDSNSTMKNRYFKNVPVTVGGKTGTSEVEGKIDYAVFSGFAPLESPEIVVTCVLEEGRSGANAAYTVGKVMENYFETKQNENIAAEE